MKKRNIGICIITTTLLMGGPAKATELILAKDHTSVVNQAVEIAAYKSNRPPVNKRLFTSKAVEAEITRVKKLLTNGEFYQFNLSSCIRQQNSLTAQFVSFSLANLANIFYPPRFLQ